MLRWLHAVGKPALALVVDPLVRDDAHVVGTPQHLEQATPRRIDGTEIVGEIGEIGDLLTAHRHCLERNFCSKGVKFRNSFGRGIGAKTETLGILVFT
jgi:hypothetical protein